METVFIHGLGQASSSWNKTLAAIPAQGSVSLPDLPALLRGQAATYPRLYHAFDKYCEELPGALNLCGISLGAILALHYPICHPQKVNTLVLIAAQYKMPVFLLKFQNFLFRFMPKASFSRLGFTKKDVISLPSTMTGLDFSAKPNHISCATLLLCGQKDAANQKATKSLGAHIPGAEVYFVEHAGHAVNEEAPEALGAILAFFYKRHARAFVDLL